MQRPVYEGAAGSGARHWAPLARFIETEARIGAWAEGRTATLALYELVRFGIKQGWACLFGALMLAVLIGTHLLYPRGAWLTEAAQDGARRKEGLRSLPKRRLTEGGR